MMKLSKYFLTMGLAIAALFSCKSDDDSSPEVTPPRDEAEVAAEDHEAIRGFLETHFYEMTPNPLDPNSQFIKVDTIAGENSEQTPIMESEFLKTKTVVQNDIDYTLYYLQIREGAPSKPKPTFADYAVVAYRGQTLDLTRVDESFHPTKLNLPGESGNGGIIKGLARALVEFRGASQYVQNPDNTIDFSDDFGIGAVFIPSGLAYFATPPNAVIPQYAPLVFTFHLYETIQGDPDEDGVPSVYEDLNNDKLLGNDFTDDDNLPNFFDADDDGDGTPTIEEVEVNDANGDGYISEDEIIFIDSNNDGTPDYLDPEVN